MYVCFAVPVSMAPSLWSSQCGTSTEVRVLEVMPTVLAVTADEAFCVTISTLTFLVEGLPQTQQVSGKANFSGKGDANVGESAIREGSVAQSSPFLPSKYAWQLGQ